MDGLRALVRLAELFFEALALEETVLEDVLDAFFDVEAGSA